MAGIITASQDKVTKRQIRFKIEKNKYGISGTLYLPKDKFGSKEPPEGLKIKIAYDRS